MNDRKILDVLQEGYRRDIDFYSNAQKDVRERWIVSQFLLDIGVEYTSDELQSLEIDNDVDVIFRDASFQTKEITDPNLLRDRDLKSVYRSIKAANEIDDVNWINEPRDLPAVTSIFELLIADATSLSKRYASKQKLDLLFYVTRSMASILLEEEISTDIFSELGWRSVSCLNSKQSVVLYASSVSAEFLKVRSQKIFLSSCLQ
jgi:hypothetical protein